MVKAADTGRLPVPQHLGGVGPLPHQADAGQAVVNRQPQAVQPDQQWIFAPAEPVADAASAQIGGRNDAGIAQAGQPKGGLALHLRQIDHRQAVFARDQRDRQPFDRDIRLTAGERFKGMVVLGRGRPQMDLQPQILKIAALLRQHISGGFAKAGAAQLQRQRLAMRGQRRHRQQQDHQQSCHHRAMVSRHPRSPQAAPAHVAASAWCRSVPPSRGHRHPRSARCRPRPDRRRSAPRSAPWAPCQGFPSDVRPPAAHRSTGFRSPASPCR